MRLLFQIAIVCISLCSIALASSRSLEDCFLHDSNWSGGDGAYSVAINEKTVLWLFGDSFIDTIGDGSNPRRMVHNTIAVQDTTSNKISFYTNKNGREAFFQSSDKIHWLWPGDAVKNCGRLYCFQKVIAPVKSLKEDPFGFSWIGDEIHVVFNPEAAPPFWKMRTVRVEQNGGIHIGVAALVENNFVYSIGLNETNKEAFLARIPCQQIDSRNLVQAEFLCRDENKKIFWSKESKNIHYLWKQAAAEASLIKVRTGYLCVYSQNGMGKNIVGRTTKNFNEDWSQEKRLYEIPEKQLKRGFCYAGKAHPEQVSPPAKLSLSYAINPGVLSAHQKDPYAYFPHFVSVDYPTCDEQ